VCEGLTDPTVCKTGTVDCSNYTASEDDERGFCYQNKCATQPLDSDLMVNCLLSQCAAGDLPDCKTKVCAHANVPQSTWLPAGTRRTNCNGVFTCTAHTGAAKYKCYQHSCASKTGDAMSNCLIQACSAESSTDQKTCRASACLQIADASQKARCIAGTEVCSAETTAAKKQKCKASSLCGSSLSDAAHANCLVDVCRAEDAGVQVACFTEACKQARDAGLAVKPLNAMCLAKKQDCSVVAESGQQACFKKNCALEADSPNQINRVISSCSALPMSKQKACRTALCVALQEAPAGTGHIKAGKLQACKDGTFQDPAR